MDRTRSPPIAHFRSGRGAEGALEHRRTSAPRESRSATLRSHIPMQRSASVRDSTRSSWALLLLGSPPSNWADCPSGPQEGEKPAHRAGSKGGTATGIRTRVSGLRIQNGSSGLVVPIPDSAANPGIRDEPWWCQMPSIPRAPVPYGCSLGCSSRVRAAGPSPLGSRRQWGQGA